MLQRFRHFAVALSLSVLLNVAGAHLAPAISATPIKWDRAHYATSTHEVAKAASIPVRAMTPRSVYNHTAREIFGFALASSLSDPTFGYPSWNFDALSTVAFFGLHVDTGGRFVPDKGWAVWSSSDLTNLVAVAHRHGVHVVLTIILQDFAPNTPDMCGGLNHADATVAETVTEVKAKVVDGVNIDYEGLNGSCGTTDPNWAQHAMTTLAQKMRAAIGATPYISIDTYAGAAGDGYGFFDVVGLANYVDSFFVMAYDMEYSNYYSAPLYCVKFCLGPTAPLTGYRYNDTGVMAQYIGAVPASKVILGVPYYGRKSCVSSASPNQYPTTSVIADSYLDASTEVSYFEVKTGSYAAHRESISAGQERWDTWYNTSLNCLRELYWDDALSLGKKYDLVNSDRLRGVGIWNLNYGGGAPELWDALATHFVACTNALISVAPASPQGTGTKATVTAGSSGCASPQYRFWIQDPGRDWSMVKDYSSASTYSWTGTGAPGSYRLEVDVRANPNVSYDSTANLTYVLNPCSGAGLKADQASPQQPGPSIVLTGSATCAGAAQYRFWIRPPGGAWGIVQDYGAVATYAWNTSGKPVGSYGLEVDVKNQGATASYETVANLDFALDAPCGKPTLTTTPASPQAVGSVVALTATTGGCPSPLYRFWIQPPGGTWTTVQDYSTVSTYGWNTSGRPAGTYQLEVDVKDKSTVASY